MNELEEFRQIYADHSNMVYNLCLNYLHRMEDAEEATQDIFVKIHQNYARFRGDSNLKTWIYRITVSHCLDILKAKKRQKRFGFMQSLFGPKGEEALPIADFNHPGVKLEDKESVQIIMQYIDSLPDNQKTAIILKAINGLSMKEIAEIMNLSSKAVESLLSRAKQNLKSKLKE